MKSLGHILVATDFSSSSLHAVDRGFLLASTAGTRYTVLHALGLDTLAQLRDLLGTDASAVSQRILDDARGALAQVVSDASRNLDVVARAEVETGMADSAVSRYAEANDVDLILLGGHGKGFLQRLLLGSTASRVLRKSKCPVLVVKEPCRARYRRVLVAVDFSPGSERAIHLAGLVAPGADIVLLHVFHVPFEGKLQYAGVGDDLINRYRMEARERALIKLHDVARVTGLSASSHSVRIPHGDPTRQILTEEENFDCDPIVMGKHGTRVTEELLFGSVTSHVLAESRSDVLVVVDSGSPADIGIPA